MLTIRASPHLQGKLTENYAKEGLFNSSIVTACWLTHGYAVFSLAAQMLLSMRNGNTIMLPDAKDKFRGFFPSFKWVSILQPTPYESWFTSKVAQSYHMANSVISELLNIASLSPRLPKEPQQDGWPPCFAS